jgi:hypothetical protein
MLQDKEASGTIANLIILEYKEIAARIRRTYV